MRTADRLLLAALLLVGVLVLLKREDPAQALPLVKADFPVCVTIKPGPIQSKTPPLPYQRQKDVA